MPRRRRSMTAWNFNFAGLLLNCGKMLAKYAGATYKDELDAAKLEKVRVDAQVSEMRRQKLSNELVIGDLKILQLKQKLGVPDDESTGWKAYSDPTPRE